RHTMFSRDWSSDVCSTDLTVSQRAAAPILPAAVTPPSLPSLTSQASVREPASVRIAHAGRRAALAPRPPTAAPAPAPVQVSIGRVEIRGAAPPAPAAATQARRGPQLGLDDYLRQRHGSGR